jgi:hypothetical protein
VNYNAYKITQKWAYHPKLRFSTPLGNAIQVYTNLIERWEKGRIDPADDSKSISTCHSHLQRILSQAVGCVVICTNRNRYPIVLEISDEGRAIKRINGSKQVQGRKAMLVHPKK